MKDFSNSQSPWINVSFLSVVSFLYCVAHFCFQVHLFQILFWKVFDSALRSQGNESISPAFVCPPQGFQVLTLWQKVQLFYQGILENGGESLFSPHQRNYSNIPLIYCQVVISDTSTITPWFLLFSLFSSVQTRGQTTGCWSILLFQSALSSRATWSLYGWGQSWWRRGSQSTSNLSW